MNWCLLLSFVTVLFGNSCMSSDSSHKICSIAECINSGNTNLSSALICNGCTAKILTHNDALHFYQLQKKLVMSYNDNRKKLAYLNVDVLYLIFDQLELEDMLNLLENYPAKTLSAAATTYFRRKFKNYLVYIHRGFINIYDQKRCKCLQVGKSAPTLLRYFEGAIQNLKIESPPPMTIQNANKYASESLTKLEMCYMYENPFKHFKKPFVNLEDFSLNCDTNITTEGLPLNQLFPAIRRLTLQSRGDIDERILGYEFPYLNHIEIDAKNMKENEIIFELFNKNRKIQSFEIGELSQDICNVINEHAMDLVNLTVSSINANVQNDTRFERVKNFKINYDFHHIDRLSFPHLELLDIVDIIDNYNIPDELNAFIRKHQHLTRVKIRKVNRHESQTLNRMTNGFLNLCEITVEKSHVRVQPISELLVRNLQLKKLNIISCYPSIEDVNSLREIFENEWDINEVHDGNEIVKLIFERKP